jgi:hypothetical protein
MSLNTAGLDELIEEITVDATGTMSSFGTSGRPLRTTLTRPATPSSSASRFRSSSSTTTGTIGGVSLQSAAEPMARSTQ